MRKTKKNKEEIAEDYCFTCKDGGHLRVCDYKNCLKSYHPQCVGKDLSFLETDEVWTCGWHLCFICQKSSRFQCFCCPSSVCRNCIREAEFVQVKKRMKGFCNNCLKLAILIEENIDVDSDGGKVDFKDTETYEFLFKDYWEIIKDQEGLTLVDLHAANALLKRGENCKSESDSDKFPEEEFLSECDDLGDDCHNEMSLLDDLKVKRGKMKFPIKRCRSRRKYIGWGSEELIGFLTSIGKGTEEPLTQLDASEIVKDYVQANNLFHPDKKKNKVVVCDEKLYSLFRKKKVKVHKIYSLLESHLAADDDMDDEFSFSSDDDDNSIIRRKCRRTNSDSKIRKSEPNHYKQKVMEPLKSCYASVIDRNIKLVYLRRSLIMNLLKNPETFENKVTGCFVRVKNDPKDFYCRPQKLYQLGQVTGIKKAPHAYKVGETLMDTVLCVSNMCRDIQITMLSDDDFEEEECEDLCKLVKKGLLKRPTVEELEKKVRIVHEDITNHWIDREIVKLQKLIDQANDKGWRRELFEYIDRRELLCTPAERARLLKEIPQVIADTEEEVEVITDTLLESHGENKGGNIAIMEALPEEAKWNGAFSCENAAEERSEAGNGADSHENAVEGQPEAGNVAAFHEDAAEEKSEDNEAALHENSVEVRPEGNEASSYEAANNEEVEGMGASPKVTGQLGIESEPLKSSVINENSNTSRIIEIVEDEEILRYKRTADVQIIDLDEDEEDCLAALKENDPSTADTCYEIVDAMISERQKVWNYIDPSGNEQGPFALASLRYWKEEGFFDDDFRVWRTGQSKEEAILLMDALR
ncbi:uncharacterized protein At5g08430-like isoform X3 [Phoenix dactylifera]|uniref:Uncharacterized protein At5g08430-like isoform X3 n=1 Tax=Phoenix dactylifera TaxID=42345 RepID=A0A8B9AWW8_PHODC|nr:uncharacterized protein At5g08430-like isoform X3 [Phoenix dactylifera]